MVFCLHYVTTGDNYCRLYPLPKFSLLDIWSPISEKFLFPVWRNCAKFSPFPSLHNCLSYKIYSNINAWRKGTYLLIGQKLFRTFTDLCLPIFKRFTVLPFLKPWIQTVTKPGISGACVTLTTKTRGPQGPISLTWHSGTSIYIWQWKRTIRAMLAQDHIKIPL